MEKCTLSLFIFFHFFLAIRCTLTSSIIKSTEINDLHQQNTYIIRVQPPEDISIDSPQDLKNWYLSFLPIATTSNTTKSRLLYTYSKAITGFAASLTIDEVREIEKKKGFLKVYPDRLLTLSTTHTPSFLGLQSENGIWNASSMGKGVIIGVVDSGIMPDHPSFRGDGFSDPPSKWKGSCTFKNFCNNKIIGAKTFLPGEFRNHPPIYQLGHWTHLAGTMAGNFVANANVLGNANGTASGVAPHSHLAIYRVCFTRFCALSDVMRGIDSAIEDGVDVISISLDSTISDIVSRPYYDDLVAIGTYSAIERGIFVSCAAGNAGPAFRKIGNDAPWILTVGASIIDRKIKAIVKLDDHREFEGESAFQPKDLVNIPLENKYFCDRELNNLIHEIVLCGAPSKLFLGTKSINQGYFVKYKGGVGMIVYGTEEEGYTTLAEAHVIPAAYMNFEDAVAISTHQSSKKNATASILFKGTFIGISPAPTVGYFSSRGPSNQTIGVLKPDIIGPVVSILAPWPTFEEYGYNNEMKFDISTGTSISAAHLSGIAALIKSIHPDWSAAMIKSAIMTTSDASDRDGNSIMDEQHNPASFFAMGAGHVNPSKAAFPGLVYDITVKDYIAFLCGMGYTNKQVELITHQKVTCENGKKISDEELNYPAIVCDSRRGKVIVNRTVTNVGEINSKHLPKVDMPKEVQVEVSPKELVFTKINEKKTYTVSLSWNSSKRIHIEGNFMWVSDNQVVRSPIVIVGM
ncbi:hypothetical protein LUZ60_001580 [Juncus effusus]|nr:hypothetical protein LUZ60_001580 [Juncus effusus]